MLICPAGPSVVGQLGINAMRCGDVTVSRHVVDQDPKSEYPADPMAWTTLLYSADDVAWAGEILIAKNPAA